MLLKQTIDVFTGEVRSADCCCDLISHSIGSCIVVVAFHPETAFGSMAHVMLPGLAPAKAKEHKFRYAEDAIKELLLQLKLPEKSHTEINICLIGAGNVLKRDDDSICVNNINSVKSILADKDLKTVAEVLGGTQRRSVRFDVSKGAVYYTEDSSPEKLLWQYAG